MVTNRWPFFCWRCGVRTQFDYGACGTRRLIRNAEVHFAHCRSRVERESSRL
ncbi:hypothetical protein [Rubritalea tangerina]|uniref:hypothetical protein n=1 Tax=Rubritalea tangerina TaxID=430798 RepID=UPI0036200084